MLFSLRIQSHQMILGQYSPLAVEFLSYLMKWGKKNALTRKKRGLNVPKKGPTNVSLIRPHAARSSWIIHDQIYVHKHTHHFYVSIHLFISSITIYSSRPPRWAVGGDKQWLLQCFVRGFKAVASLQRCQHFDVTRHVPRTKPTASSCLRPARGDRKIIRRQNSSQQQRDTTSLEVIISTS